MLSPDVVRHPQSPVQEPLIQQHIKNFLDIQNSIHPHHLQLSTAAQLIPTPPQWCNDISCSYEAQSREYSTCIGKLDYIGSRKSKPVG